MLSKERAKEIRERLAAWCHWSKLNSVSKDQLEMASELMELLNEIDNWRIEITPKCQCSSRRRPRKSAAKKV